VEIHDGQPITLSAVATESQVTYTWVAGLTPAASSGIGSTAPTFVGNAATVVWTPSLGLLNCADPVLATITVVVVDALGKTATDTIEVLVDAPCSPT